MRTIEKNTSELINSTEHEVAREIYFKINPPKSHQDWADSFSRIAVIRDILLKWKDEK